MQIGGMYTIDFARVSKIPKFEVTIKNGDSKRTIKLILLKNSEVLNLNDYTVVVAAKKIDGKDIFNDVKTIDAESGICEVEITEQMLALDIDLPCEIVLYNADGVVASSSNFVISKISSLKNEENIVSSNEFTALTKALSEVKNIDINFARKADVEYVNTKISSIASGSPKGVYKTLSDLKIDFPNGDESIYIVSQNGNWYYWSGSTWESGGLYQSSKLGKNEVIGDNIHSSVIAKTLLFPDTFEYFDTKISNNKVINGTDNSSNPEYYTVTYANNELSVGSKYNFIIKTDAYDLGDFISVTFRYYNNGVSKNENNATYIGNGAYAILDAIVLEEGVHQFYIKNTSSKQITILDNIGTKGGYPLGEGLKQIYPNTINSKHIIEKAVKSRHIDNSSISGIHTDKYLGIKILNTIKNFNKIDIGIPENSIITTSQEYLTNIYSTGDIINIGNKYNFLIYIDKPSIDVDKVSAKFRKYDMGTGTLEKSAVYLGDGIFIIDEYEVNDEGTYQLFIRNQTGEDITVKKIICSIGGFPISDSLKELDDHQVTYDKIAKSVPAKLSLQLKAPNLKTKISDLTLVKTGTIDDRLYLERWYNTENELDTGEKYTFVFKTNFTNGDRSDIFKFRKRTNNVNANQVTSDYIGDGVFVIADYEVIEEGDYQLLVFNDSGIDILIYEAIACKNGVPISRHSVNGDVIKYVSPLGDDNGNGSKLEPYKSIQKAIDTGATIVYAQAGDYIGQSLKVNNQDKLHIKLDNPKEFNKNNPDRPTINIINAYDIEFEYDSLSGLYKCPLKVDKNNRLYKVFVSKELPPVSDYRMQPYNATIWEICKDITKDIQLKPVLTIEECKNNISSFFYDGELIYINPTDNTIIDKQYKTMILNDYTDLVSLTNIKDLVIEDFRVSFGIKRSLYTDYISSANFHNVTTSHTCMGSGHSIYNTNGEYYFCKSYRNKTDGFGIAGYGDTHFFNCFGFSNDDDGISHHDGCTGSIVGGEWYNNGKGGVAPAHGCIVDVHNVISHHNNYGMYAIASPDTTVGRKVRHIGNVYYDNNIGIGVSNYHVISYNCSYTNNKTPMSVSSDQYSSLTEL